MGILRCLPSFVLSMTNVVWDRARGRVDNALRSEVEKVAAMKSGRDEGEVERDEDEVSVMPVENLEF